MEVVNLVGTIMKNKTYTELSAIESFEERYEYLKLSARVGESTFGFNRFLNQNFYMSKMWRDVRDMVIIRDNGCDLGVEGYEINDTIYVHHMNPIVVEDILDWNSDVLNPEYLISTSYNTHQAIHYSDKGLLPKTPVIRQANDTSPWKK